MGYGQGLLMSIMRIFLYFMIIIVILFSLLFLFNVNKSNEFISQSDDIITRSGGLTQSAYDKINKLSSKYYHGHYHVSINPNFNRTSDMLKADNKGFTDNMTTNYQNNGNASGNDWSQSSKDEVPYGNSVKFYVYSDVPMYGHLNYHSGQLTSKPMAQTVASAIRAGSQY